MVKWLVIGFVFFCIGLVFRFDPTQFLANNEIMSRKINSSVLYKRIFKAIGILFSIIGIIIFILGVTK